MFLEEKREDFVHFFEFKKKTVMTLAYTILSVMANSSTSQSAHPNIL